MLMIAVLNRTGIHTVADVFCLGCSARLGWYYTKASDSTQKYKEGLPPVSTIECVMKI